MIQRLVLFILTLTFSSSVFAQAPQPISVQGKLGVASVPLKNDCGNEAGTFTFAPFTGMSNDVAGDTVFLCLGDAILTQSDVSTTLFDGDPNPDTPGGVGYALYSCVPTVEGQDLATVAADSCAILTGDPENPLIVAASFTNDGNVTFLNDGGLQAQFNSSDPAVLWFAPITYDELLIVGGLPRAQYEEPADGGNAGPCVDVSIDQAFAVAYLNEIVVANATNSQGCQGSFQVQGGLSELDGSAYNISISLDSDPSVSGLLLNPDATEHGSTVLFSVPQAGTYNVSVSDGKACPANAQITIDQSSCNPVVFNLPSTNFPPGSTNQCVDVTVENFTNVLGFQFPLRWDPTIIEFVEVTNLNPNLPTFTMANSIGDTRVDFGELSIAWADLNNFSQVSLTDGEVLFSICFNAIGAENEVTDFIFDPVGIPALDVVGENGTMLGFQGNDGTIIISNQSYFLTINSTNETCDRSDDGSISFEVSGGVAPYTYELVDASNMVVASGTIDTRSGSFTFTDLEPGDYQVILVDSNTSDDVLGEVVASDMIMIESGLRLGVNLELQSGLECAGFTNGVIRAAISENGFAVSATNEYSIEWRIDEDGPIEATGEFLRDAEAGLQYFVTVARGECSRTASASFTSPMPLDLELQSLQDATCEGVEDGGVAVSISGGSTLDNGTYSVQWSNLFDPINVPALNPAQQGNLAPAAYNVVITDNNGCQDSLAFNIDALRSINADAVVSDVLCFGGEDGNIQVTASAQGAGEARPYDFTWTTSLDENSIPDDTEISSTLDSLDIGNYILLVQDADGCTTLDTFTIAQPEPLTLTASSIQEASCDENLMDGAIEVTTTGGTAPYTYFWPEIEGLTTENAERLTPGIYEVVVTDANGCTETNSDFIVTAPDLPQITSLEDDNVDCFGDTDGTLFAAATSTSGAAIVSYEWSNGQTGQTIENLPAGTYTVRIEDADGCFVIDTALVIQPDPIDFMITDTQMPSCPGSADGSITIMPLGGTGPYDYTIDDFGIAENVTAETYTYQNLMGEITYALGFTDDSGCGGVAFDGFLEDPLSVNATFSEIDSTRCADDPNGGATVTALFEDGSSGIFNFAWANSQRVDDNTTMSRATDLIGGANTVNITYESLVVSDAICSFIAEVNIPSPEPLLPVVAATGVSCFGDTDGSIELTPIGGTPPYRYELDDNAINAIQTDLAPGTYSIVVRDANECEAQTSAEVPEPAELVLSVVDSLTDDSVTCEGDMDARITIAVEGGNPLGLNPFAWPNGVAGTTDSTAFELAPGTYIITVTDQNDCVATEEHIITEPEAITAIIPTPVEPRCNDARTAVTVSNAFGGSGGYFFLVNGNERNPLLIMQEDSIFGGREHLITVFDTNGCRFDTTLFVEEPEPIEVILPETVEVQLGDSIILEPDIFSTFGIENIIWTPGLYLSDTSEERPTISPINDQQYTIMVRDINGCEGRANTLITVDKKRNVYVPNAFSPFETDGFNDRFQVFTGTGVTAIPSMRIYDRWGELLFEADNLSPNEFGTDGWDGTFKGQPVNEGVYVYLVEVQFLDEVTLTYRGSVSLVR